MRLVILLVGALALPGCATLARVGSTVTEPFQDLGGVRGRLAEINGVRFRSRISVASPDRRGFVTRTGGASRGVASAAEAGRLRAVEYCLERFGGSEIVWSAGPDRPVEEMTLDRDVLFLRGTCVTR